MLLFADPTTRVLRKTTRKWSGPGTEARTRHIESHDCFRLSSAMRRPRGNVASRTFAYKYKSAWWRWPAGGRSSWPFLPTTSTSRGCRWNALSFPPLRKAITVCVWRLLPLTGKWKNSCHASIASSFWKVTCRLHQLTSYETRGARAARRTKVISFTEIWLCQQLVKLALFFLHLFILSYLFYQLWKLWKQRLYEHARAADEPTRDFCSKCSSKTSVTPAVHGDASRIHHAVWCRLNELREILCSGLSFDDDDDDAHFAFCVAFSWRATRQQQEVVLAVYSRQLATMVTERVYNAQCKSNGSEAGALRPAYACATTPEALPPGMGGRYSEFAPSPCFEPLPPRPGCRLVSTSGRPMQSMVRTFGTETSPCMWNHWVLSLRFDQFKNASNVTHCALRV